MKGKKYLVLLWHKCKNVAMCYAENLDVIKTIRAMHKHDDCEVVDMEMFAPSLSDDSLVPDDSPEQVSRSWATGIRCVETGKEWESLAECRRQTGIGFFVLNSACQTGRDVNGLHYEYVPKYNKKKK